MIDILIKLEQNHIVGLCKTMKSRKECLQKCINMAKYYPGGIEKYISSARLHLSASAKGENPYSGFVPSVPRGKTLLPFTNAFTNAEACGMENIKDLALCLVAGGMGERLGYKGIKIELPMEVTTGTSFLGYYAENILALQERAGEDVIIPLAIMTSGDTHDLTVKLLEVY